MGVVQRLVRLGAGVGVVVLALTIAAVLYFSDRNLERHGAGRSLDEPVDAMLVLGAGIDGDGFPAYSSRRRVAGAVALLEAGRTGNIIISGAGYPVASAERMRGFAELLGAPPGAVLVEPRARSTFENLRFGLAMAEANGFKRVAILTDAYHLERARWLAAYFGYPDVGLVAVAGLGSESWQDRAWSIAREALAWWYNLAKVAGWEALGAAGVEAHERQQWIQ